MKCKIASFVHNNTQHHQCITHAGLEVVTPDGVYRSKGMLLLFTADLPARAAVMNMKNFNGEYACSTCEDKGDNTRGNTPLHQVWPFTDVCTTRNPRGVKDAFKTAVSTRKPVK